MPCSIPQSLDEVLTPSRKRKRRSGDLNINPSCNGLANEGFSSTPRKTVTYNASALSRSEQNGGIVGINPFGSYVSCMEVKSIAEIASETIEGDNPFEVIRKPPKKKKKADIEEACFENPALNLEGPDKRFNPFEVKRETVSSANDNCFVNSALNIKSPENIAVNPYEITRTVEPAIDIAKEGIENPALEELTTPVTIAIPFTPRIGCRIDFTGVSFDSLTPSKLLAEKLVFSPPVGIKGSAYRKSFRRSLSVISEETVDIGKELDCYQLELENSINEAKLKKKSPSKESISVKGSNYSANFVEEQSGDDNKTSSISISITNINISAEIKSPASEMTPPPTVATPKSIEEASDADVSFDDELDFKEPAPFVRCYRKGDLPRTSSMEIDQQTNTSKGSNKSDSSVESKRTFTDLIRKSIRKIVHSKHDTKKSKDEKSTTEDECQSSGTNNFMATLRRSMRRKTSKNESNNNTDSDAIPLEEKQEISIIDMSEKRKVFKTGDDETKLNSKPDSDGKPFSLRKSFRKSTRDIRNQVMKKVFHKNVEEYTMRN